MPELSSKSNTFKARLLRFSTLGMCFNETGKSMSVDEEVKTLLRKYLPERNLLEKFKSFTLGYYSLTIVTKL